MYIFLKTVQTCTELLTEMRGERKRVRVKMRVREISISIAQNHRTINYNLQFRIISFSSRRVGPILSTFLVIRMLVTFYFNELIPHIVTVKFSST
jgi:hypothetical protein